MFIIVSYHILDIKLSEKRKLLFLNVISVVLLISGVVYGWINHETEKHFVSALVGFFFFNAGTILKRKEHIFVNMKIYKKLFLAIVFGAATYLLSGFNTPVLMYVNDYGNALLFVPCAILGSLSLFLISMCIKKNKFLEFLGKNSLTILVTHFAVYTILGYVLKLLIPAVDLKTAFWSINTMMYLLLLFTLTVVTEFFIVKIVNKFFPYFTGKISLK